MSEKLKSRRRKNAKRHINCRRSASLLVYSYWLLADGVRVEGITLPHPENRHVLAFAVHGKATVVVTNNSRDFSSRLLFAKARTEPRCAVALFPLNGLVRLSRDDAAG